MGRFDMGEFAKTLQQANVSNSDTGREQIEYIDIGLLDADDKNFYELSGLEELAANIELVGLQQPLRVRANPDRPGRYTIVSGHRRRAALQILVDAGRTELREIPCIREQPAGSAALQELRLIYANSDTRKLSSADLAKQAERVKMLLYQLKEEGIEFPGRMRDYVAEACKVSKSKLARLDVIRKGLGPEFLPLYEKGRLPEQSAYTLAKFPRAFQARISSAFRTVPTGATLEKLLGLYKDKGFRWEPDMSCPDGKPCKQGDVFLRHDVETYSSCGGEKCCLDCREATAEYYACGKACSKAKAIRTEKNNKRKAKEQAAQAKREADLQKQIRGHAKRLVRAADAAGISDDTVVAFTRYGRQYSAGQLRALAAGDFSHSHFYHDELEPDSLLDYIKTAEILHCSLDYIMGAADELTPTDPELSNENEAPDGMGAEGEAENRMMLVRWESRSVTPPIGALLQTYDLTNAGPVLRPAVWDGAKFHAPGHPEKPLSGLQFTQWIQLPPPHSGEAYRLDQGEVGVALPLRWRPPQEAPASGQLAVGRFFIEGAPQPLRTIVRWERGHWCFPASKDNIDAECIGWWPIPADEEAGS